MALYTSTFNGNPVDPAYPSFNLIELDSDITLQWATAFQDTDYAVAGIMNVNPSLSGYTITLPNATFVSPGKAFIITNTASDELLTFSLLKADSSVLIPAISNTEGYFVYLQDNSSPEGDWGIIPFTGSDAITFVAAVSLTPGLTINGSPITDAGTFQFSIDLLTLWNNIANNSLNASKLLDGSVTTDKIADGAVTTPKIGLAAVTTGKIALGAVVNNNIASSAVTTTKIADSAVTGPKIADGAVTTDKISDAAVTGQELANGAVTSDKIASMAVTTPKINSSAVTTDKIAAGAVTTDKIAAGAVTTDKIADSAVTTDKIADSAVTTDKIADSAVTAGKMDLSARRRLYDACCFVESVGLFVGVPFNAVSVNKTGAGTYVIQFGPSDTPGSSRFFSITPLGLSRAGNYTSGPGANQITVNIVSLPSGALMDSSFGVVGFDIASS
jgi:hypothetical protein